MSPVDERMFTIDAFEEDLQDLELTSGGSRTPRSSSERKEHDGKTPMAVFPDMQDMMQQVPAHRSDKHRRTVAREC